MPTPYRTRADLVTEALANLGVLSSGQAIDPEDYNYVDEKLEAIFRKLSALEIVTVADPATIPGEWFSDLADIVAGETCTKLGSTSEDYVKLVNKGLGGVQGVDVGQGAAAKSLRQMMRLKPTGQVVASEFF